MIRDPRDRELPSKGGQYYLEDPFTGEKLYVDSAQYASAYKRLAQKEEEYIEKQFKATKSALLRLQTDQDFYKPLIKFFKKRSLTHR